MIKTRVLRISIIFKVIIIIIIIITIIATSKYTGIIIIIIVLEVMIRILEGNHHFHQSGTATSPFHCRPVQKQSLRFS